MDIKVEVKEEPIWLEDSLADTKSEATNYSKESPQNEFKVKEENQEAEVDISSLKDDIAVEQLPSLPLEPYRLPAEILSVPELSASLLFDGAEMAEKYMLEEETKTSAIEKTKKCDICGKAFYRSTLLRKHVLHHKLEEFHQCELCGKGFTALLNLNRHYCRHKTKMPRKCNVCGKGFIYMHNFRLHRFIHKHKNTYSCAVCEKHFMNKSILKEHYLTHG